MKKPGERPYTIKCIKLVLKKDIPALPADVKPGILKIIYEDLVTDPIGIGKKLLGKFKGTEEQH